MIRKIAGVVPPIITPLAGPNRLDRPALERLIERLLGAGVSGVFTLGTTGEGPTLSGSLRREVVAAVCEIVEGRASVLVGVTDTAIADSLALAEHAQRCGADAIVAAPLMYFAPRPIDVREYFKRLAETSPLPLMLYDMPACARTEITFDTVAACASLPRVIGVKDSSGDFRRFQRLLQLKTVRPDWSFMIGPELLTADAVRAGGDGCVAGGANVDPALFVLLCRAAQEGNDELVQRCLISARRLGQLYALSDDSLAVVRGVKSALCVRGECRDQLAVPYGAATEEFRDRVRAVLASLDADVESPLLTTPARR